MSGRQRYGLSDRTLLTAEPPFTATSLRDTIAAAAGPHYAPMEGAAAARLAGILNQQHAWFYVTQEDHRQNRLIAQARAALSGLAELLTQVRNELSDRNTAVAGKDPFLSAQLADAERAAAFIETPANWKFLEEGTLPGVVQDWRWLAKVLPADIEAAMRPTNPRFRAGISDGGPFVRILAAIIPAISGESPTPNAIKVQLVALRKDDGGA